MSNPRSSSRAESRARRSHWPWLLAAGPAIVVVASLVTAWLAISRNDALVAEDYYKLGLTINRTLAASAPAVRDPIATIVIAPSGEVRVDLHDASPEPTQMRLTVRRPGERQDAHVLRLAPAAGGRWVGALQDLGPERRIVSLESDTWRLPVTVIERVPATFTLGATRPNR
jgi:hypothetical protein